MAANQSVSGSLVAWKIVPAVGDVRRGRCLLLAPVALIETPTRQHVMLPMAAAGADEAARPAQPDQRRAALLLGAEGLPKRLVAQTAHSRCNLEPHNRDPLIPNILRTYIPTGGVSRISRMVFTKPRSFTGAGRSAHSRPSSSPLWNGWIGSTTGGSWSPSETSRRPKPRNATTPCWSSQTWRRDSNKMASAKPGAVQSCDLRNVSKAAVWGRRGHAFRWWLEVGKNGRGYGPWWGRRGIFCSGIGDVGSTEEI